MVMADALGFLAADDDIGSLTPVGSYTSTKSIPLSPAASELRELGMGNKLIVDVNVTETFAGGGNLTVFVVMSPSLPGELAAPVANQVYLGASGPHAASKLTAETGGTGTTQGTRFSIAVSPFAPRLAVVTAAGFPYLNLVYLVEGSVFTAGKISARLTVASRSEVIHYPASTGGLSAWNP